MTAEAFTQNLDVWIAQYVAGFCVATITAWGLGMYLWSEKWERGVRDCSVYFLAIGALMLVLAFRPENIYELWRPVTWFCFSMLLIMELLWLSFLGESIYRAFRDIPNRAMARTAEQHRGYRRIYPRP